MAKSIQEISRDYRRGHRGVLTKRYLEMKAESKKFGLEILSRKEFFAYGGENEAFRHIFYDWTKSDYNRKLSPALERKDFKQGFIWENLRWTTSGNKNRSNGIEVKIMNPDKKEITYPSMRKADLELCLTAGTVSRALRTGKSNKGIKFIKK